MESVKKETQAEGDGQEWGGDPRGPIVPTTVPGVSQAGHTLQDREGEERGSWTRAPVFIRTLD